MLDCCGGRAYNAGMEERIYFDNAATSFPKPEVVHQAVAHYGREIGASAGRGAYREAIESGEIIGQTRRHIAQLIGAADPNSIIMTFNCTDGLALAIKGIVTSPDDHVVTTRMEHNSVLRPLNALQQQLGIDITHVPADSEGLIDPEDIRRAIKANTKLIALVHGSNVCGSVQDIAAVGRIASEHEIVYLVDAAQTTGHLPINVQDFHVDLLAFPGHKALLGPLGTGALYIRPRIEHQMRTLKEGGTGSRSEVPVQPTFLPDRFEAGSHNALGIAGLNAGVQYSGLKVYGPTDLDKRVGVFSVTIGDYAPGELAGLLEERFGLLTRPGLHCAPFAHQSIGSFELGGTTRFSTGIFIDVDDVNYAGNALRKIASSCCGNNTPSFLRRSGIPMYRGRNPVFRL